MTGGISSPASLAPSSHFHATVENKGITAAFERKGARNIIT
jgi:hypothetical protein